MRSVLNYVSRKGRIPVLVDNNQSPPFTVMETSAELLYLLKEVDKEDKFGFKDEFERSQSLQWLFFWHGSGAPYQGQTNHFRKAAPEKIPCTSPLPLTVPILGSIRPFSQCLQVLILIALTHI